MENYIMDGAAVLSKDNIAGTDNLIASALDTVPQSAVANIMPITKTQGPASQWVEPVYYEDKIKLLSTPIIIDDDNTQRRLEFSCVAADDIRRMYTPEGFVNLVRNWILFLKHQRQREQLVGILQSPEIESLPYTANGATITNITDDTVELLKSQIMMAIQDLMKRHQLGSMDMSIIGPFEIAFAVLELQTKLPGKINFMGDDSVKDIYVFPTGTANLGRAGFSVFEFSDSVQRTYDPQSGAEVYFVYNRSIVVLNPVHVENPIVNKIQLV